MTPREAALQVLIACRREQGWSNAVVKQQIHAARLSRRDASLAARLSYGVIQNRMLLDFYLEQLLTDKQKKLHPVLRDILHLGLYQLKCMDRIPHSAAVNESVALAKRACPKLTFAPGLVNAVLRGAAQTQLDQPEDLPTLYSHPRKLVSLLTAYVGEENLEGMLRADNEIAPTVAQVNTLRTTAAELTACLQAQGVTVTPHSWMKNALVLSGTGNLEELEAFQKGLFYIQDAASRLAVECAQIPAKADWQVLDCCAAPGGKSFAAAMALAGCGHITSCDIHLHKIGLLRAGAQRLGLDNMTAQCRDASQSWEEKKDFFDLVLCDVPCSGYGILRKKPDIRYKAPATMQELWKLQLQILLTQADLVRPGGRMIYSTCTLVRRENEGVVEKFLARRPDFSLRKLPLPQRFPENNGMLRLIPGQHDTDGFFIARLERNRG